jgi:hypothetical protein
LTSIVKQEVLAPPVTKKRSIKGTDDSPWLMDAVHWLHEHCDQIPAEPATRWHVAKPTVPARVNALKVIRYYVPGDIIPVELGVTLDRGIELECRNGGKQVEVEVLADGSIEVVRYQDGLTVEEIRVPKPNWRLSEAFVWPEQQ